MTDELKLPRSEFDEAEKSFLAYLGIEKPKTLNSEYMHNLALYFHAWAAAKRFYKNVG